MPAGSIENKDDVLVSAGPHVTGERRQDEAENRGVDGLDNEPHNLTGDRSDKAIEIQPLKPVVALGDRATAARCPDLAQDRLQAEPMFIERPDFNRYRRFRALEFRDPGLEFF
jgi:hypothetical protein